MRRELLPDLIPPFVGADSMQTSIDSSDYRFLLKEDASRFEGALPNAPGIAGLCASLQLMKKVGFENIYSSAWNVSGYFVEQLKQLGISLAPCALKDTERSTIVSFLPPDSERSYHILKENKIACSFRCGYVRTGIHGYNTIDEVDQVICVLKDYLRSIG